MSEDFSKNENNANNEFDLDAFLASFDFAAAQKRLDDEAAALNRSTDSSTGAQTAQTLDATMSYAAIGEHAPELPSGHTESLTEYSPHQPEHHQPKQHQQQSAKQSTRQSQQSGSPASNTTQTPKARPSRHSSSSDSGRSVSSAPRSASLRATTKLYASTIARSAQQARSSTTVRVTRDPAHKMSSSDPFRPLTEHSNTYPIRGGGDVRATTTSITTTGLLAVAGLAVCILLLIFVLPPLFSGFDGPSPITLTQEQTRQALDSDMPLLTGILASDFDSVSQTLSNDGQTIFQDARYTPDSIDPTATRVGIVRLPSAEDTAFIDRFYEDSYNAYSAVELQDHFNGAWVLDMTRGDLGSLFRVRYVNLNAASIDDEIEHLASAEGLLGDGSTVVDQGIDSRGNTVMQGTKAIGDVVYYWRVAACPFDEVYSTDSVPESSVYISVTVASYDFYTGSDTLK